ncbi:glycerophosphodiester phosphodiesterase [Treponema sp.]
MHTEEQILVYGHRGARAYAPMNTLAAFALAIEMGADGIELDVQLCADRELIVLHDFTVDGTTDGQGKVADLLLAELKELDASYRFEAMAEPLSTKTGVNAAFSKLRIPTLEEVFVLVHDAAAKNFMVNVEIKAPYEATLEGDASTNRLEEVLSDCIKRYKMEKQCIVSSFNPASLYRMKKLCPHIPIGYLREESSPDYCDTLMAALEHEAWHPRYSLASAEAIAAEIKRGHRVNVWTVNDEAETLRLAASGVSGIITDMPDRILQFLGR